MPVSTRSAQIEDNIFSWKLHLKNQKFYYIRGFNKYYLQQKIFSVTTEFQIIAHR